MTNASEHKQNYAHGIKYREESTHTQYSQAEDPSND